MEISGFQVQSVLDGTFGLDGGAMFGIVPKPLWTRRSDVDGRNRIPLAARCLLIRGRDRRILVDTGLGDKFDDKRADIFDVDRPEGGLPGRLERLGIEPGDVTDVILTHLHFDHCGGTTRRVDGELELVFPEAVHHVQRRNWHWAHHPSDRDAGSYRDEDFAPLRGSGRLHLVDGDVEILPGIRLHVVEGHTPGMQMVRVGEGEGSLLYLADLVPTRAHLRAAWIMGYDVQPLVTLEEKRSWLPRAAEAGWIVAFEHDPETAVARLTMEDGEARVRETLEL